MQTLESPVSFKFSDIRRMAHRLRQEQSAKPVAAVHVALPTGGEGDNSMSPSTVIRSVGKVLVAALILTQTPAWADIEVYDSAKQLVGALMDIHPGQGVKPNQQVKVMVPELDRLMTIDVATGDLVTAAGTSVWFSDPRCSGTPYVDSTLFYSIGRLSGIYYTGASQEPVKVRVFSSLRVEADGTVSCTTQRLGTAVVGVPALAFKELSIHLPVKLPMWFLYR